MPYHCLNNGNFDCNGEPDWSVQPKEVKINESSFLNNGVCGNDWTKCPKIKKPPEVTLVSTGVHVHVKVVENKSVEEKKASRKKEKKEVQQGSLF
jgi:hypothetical protein